MKPKIVAIHGAKGSFAEQAAGKLYPHATLKYCKDGAEIEKVLRDGDAEIAVLPIHNTIYGEVADKTKLIAVNKWQVVAEVELKVVQNLIGAKSSSIERIEVVESHPAAIAQCTAFLRRFPHWRIIESDNTAESTRCAAEDLSATRAAIADARTAEVYGGKILAVEIQNSAANYTKFVAVQKEKRSTSEGERSKAKVVGNQSACA